MFARKLIHIFGTDHFRAETERMVMNEFRAVSKLCRPGMHRNIVSVLDYGKFPHGDVYYIDMELCDITLDYFIARDWPPELRDHIPQSLADPQGSTFFSQWWNIMEDITSGVAYIHFHNEVHRDIKPRNSTNLIRDFLIPR